MAQIKAKEFRDKSIEELEVSLLDSRKAIFELKSEQRQTKQLKNPVRLRLLKREIARIHTIIAEKERATTQNN